MSVTSALKENLFVLEDVCACLFWIHILARLDCKKEVAELCKCVVEEQVFHPLTILMRSYN